MISRYMEGLLAMKIRSIPFSLKKAFHVSIMTLPHIRIAPIMDSHNETFGGIDIRGSKDFIAEMKEALVLLQFSPSFQKAFPFLNTIDADYILGPNGDKDHRYDARKPAYNHSSISYGGDIASLACRAMLRQGKEKGSSKRTDVDKQCAEFRAKVEQELYRFSLNDYRQSFMHW
jgi:hypothetical protein